MNNNQQISTSVLLGNQNELSRMLSAAVVSRKFRDLLLLDPKAAVHSSYQGEVFNLDADETAWLLSTRPTDLADLAAQMVVFKEQRLCQQPALPVQLPVESMIAIRPFILS